MGKLYQITAAKKSDGPAAKRRPAAETRGRGESRFERAGLLGKYTLVFVLKYIKQAWQNNLTLDQLDRTAIADESAELGERLANSYAKELESGRPSFARALFRVFGLQLIAASVFNTLSRSLFFPTQVVSLGWLIKSIGDYSSTKLICSGLLDSQSVASNSSELVYCSKLSANWTLQQELEQIHFDIKKHATIQSVSLVLAICSLHPFFFKTNHLGMKCRIAACHVIYHKALRLSQASLRHASAGQMVNLLSNDVNRFDHAVQFLSFLVDAPLQTAIIVALLVFFYLGLYPTLAGLATILLFMLLQTSTARLIGRIRARTALRTDKRLQLISELVHAIQLVKMFAWESSFETIVGRARNDELKQIRLAAALKAFNHTLFFASSKFVVFAMLIVHMLLGGQLRPEIVYVSIGLCNMMRLSVNLQLNNAIMSSSETLISCARINKFLRLAEHDFRATARRRRVSSPSGGSGPKANLAIKMERLNASWSQNSTPILQNLTLEIRAGELILIVGRVGGGKSSLLLSLLGELPLGSGLLELDGSLSYAPQEAWIFYGSVRDNILLGKAFDSLRYNEVIRVCALERDLQLLVAGDQTIVGERGVSLSGGQRARVNLARALYQEASVYLLDDPLSAVDAPVAEHIFSEALIGFLRNKTVVLATNQLQFLSNAKRVLVLNGNQKSGCEQYAFGTLGELVNESQAFERINFEIGAFREALEKQRQQPSKPKIKTYCAGKLKQLGATIVQTASLKLKASHPKPLIGAQENFAGQPGNRQSAYSNYFGNAFSFATAILVPLLFVLCSIMNQFVDYVVSLWTDSFVRRQLAKQNFRPQTYLDSLTQIQVTQLYALLNVALILATLLLLGAYMGATLRASRKLHEKLLSSLVRAKMSYFDSTSIGLLLNRCGRDLGFVDQQLPHSSVETLVALLTCLSSLALTVFLMPSNAGLAIALLAMALLMRAIGLRTVINLKHLEGVARAPVFAHLSSSLDGVVAIRAFKVEHSFGRKFDEQQDLHSSAWFAFMSTCLWIVRCMDWLGLLIVGLIVTISISQSSIETLGASLIGLMIAQSVHLPAIFAVSVRSLVEVESQLTSVQRIAELGKLEAEENCDKKQTDCQLGLEGCQTKTTDPKDKVACGEIKFSNVSLRYSQNKPLVLNELSFVVGAREKVAVVGRTGAGKSSIIAALFRLYDFAGHVHLDGNDTKLMSLNELRRKISIIPQEPILFSGSLRKNLDPFDEHSDEELWAALEAVQLRRVFSGGGASEDGLEFHVNEGGANFSVGQRQLICLARAIVRKNNILVLDEATANVDPETDSFIQTTIAKQFAECTVLTIAHRLVTIVNADRVLVLDGGRLREFDEPWKLLQMGASKSLFAQMVESSSQQAPELTRLIENAHRRRQQQVERLGDS